MIDYIESSPSDQLQPKHSTREYPKPGDVLDAERPVLFDVGTRRRLVVDDALFPNAYEMSDIAWRKDSRAFTFEYNQRGHQVYRVIEVDGTSGKARAVISEESPTFFCYYSKEYRYDVGDGREIIWMSERDGWNHLYLYDGATGKVKNQITNGRWVVRRVDKVDEEKRQIYFRASGMDGDSDPYLLSAYRIDFSGNNLVALTGPGASHTVNYSSDMKYYVDISSRVDLPPVAELRRSADKKLLMELERGDISGLLNRGWRMPEVFTAKGRDGKTDIWGIICRPTLFDPSKRYPVIEYIYAGPHDSFVPKTFSPYYAMQALAELGFIVVQIDGMGTSNRSKAFHDVCWKNLSDAGFPDRILWHKAVAAKYPSYDIARVGIYGHSAGGQNALGALLFHPEFYQVAVASCGCHDNRMDKISWNEQWMGWPVGPEYAACSNADNASRLKGKLLLIVGEMDANVDPSSTMQVANALIKANKTFDLLVLPGQGHSWGGAYGERKRYDFFVHNLLGVEPPDWNGTKD
jgi:dipeptidyl aminopeptidase/acylaminoacyl peptidase